MASSGWMFADNPFITLSFNKELAAIRSRLDRKYFETLVEKVLLKNSHACTVVMEPKPGLEKELATELEGKLAVIKSKMTPAEIAAIVKQTKDLVAYQQRQDDPEALQTIPLLEIADIEKKQEDLPLKTGHPGRHAAPVFRHLHQGDRLPEPLLRCRRHRPGTDSLCPALQRAGGHDVHRRVRLWRPGEPGQPAHRRHHHLS